MRIITIIAAVTFLLPGISVAGSIYTPPTTSGGGAVGDWAVTTPAVGDFSTSHGLVIGGADEGCIEALPSGAPKLRGLLKADCVTTWGATDRTMGMVRAVAGGNFRIAFRLQFSRSDVARATGSTQLLAGPVFVDGTSVAANSWYGAALYLASTTLLNSGVMKLESTAGVARWETYSTFTANVLPSPSLPESDWVLERDGTTLNIYTGPARGAGFLVATFTVSAGAGYVGVRSQTLLSDATAVDIAVVGYEEGLTALPW